MLAFFLYDYGPWAFRASRVETRKIDLGVLWRYYSLILTNNFIIDHLLPLALYLPVGRSLPVSLEKEPK